MPASTSFCSCSETEAFTFGFTPPEPGTLRPVLAVKNAIGANFSEPNWAPRYSPQRSIDISFGRTVRERVRLNLTF